MQNPVMSMERFPLASVGLGSAPIRYGNKQRCYPYLGDVCPICLHGNCQDHTKDVDWLGEVSFSVPSGALAYEIMCFEKKCR